MDGTAHRGSRSGPVALVLASLLWGTTGTSASFLPANVSPLAVGASTMGVGGLLLFAATARPAIRVLRDRVARRWVVLGAVGVFVYPLAFYAGMNLAGVAVGNVVALGSGPVFAAILEWAIERRALSRRWLVATLIAVLGIVLLTIGLVLSNFGAMAMEPLGHIAGTASSVQGFTTTVGGALIGFAIGQHFDGSAVPMTLGFVALGAASLAIVCVTEHGRLFKSTPVPSPRAQAVIA